jgi:hypothetical protein
MRIVIDIDGQNIAAVTTGDVRPLPEAHEPPGPPPAGLLERAKKLGAMSAGAAQFGTGAALASAHTVTPRSKQPARKRRK